MDRRRAGIIDDEILFMLDGFSQMRLPVVLDEINKWHPAVDVYESGNRLIVIVELAGVDPKDVSVSQKDDVISICGIRRETIPHPPPIYHHLELNYGPFERNLKLPPSFIGSKIQMGYKNGFLKIVITANSDMTDKSPDTKCQEGK